MAKRKPEAEPEEEEEEIEEIEEEVEEIEEEVEEDDIEEGEEEVEEEDDEEEEEDGEEMEEEGGGNHGEQEKDDGEDEISKREAIRNLLEPFGKDQLIDFLREAAARNPSLIQKISDAAESDPVHRKLFVHGLGWDATNEALAAVFHPFGEIEQCNVVIDKATGKSRGFGFVLFRTRAGAQNALKQPQKKVGNRTTSCHLASFGPINDGGNMRKIYVSNIGPDVNPESLRSFFERFGEIEEAQMGHDQATGKLRGYAFFTYKTVDGCKKALEEPMKVFEGCQLQCKRAFENLRSKIPTAVGGLGPGGMLPPNDLALMYASSSLMGMMSQNMNPTATALVGHNPGVGMLNHAAVAAGLSPSVSRMGTTPPTSFGVASAFSGRGSGVNSISPSVIGNYTSAALQGLGSYQNAHLSSTADMRSQSGVGSFGNSYLGR